jgi:hypothetical protein
MSRAWPSVYERSDWQEVHLKGRCSTVPSLHHSIILPLHALSSISWSFLCYMLHHSKYPCSATPRGCDNGGAILCRNGNAGNGGIWEGERGRSLCTGVMIVSSLFEPGVYHLFRSANRFEGVVIVWATSDERAEFPSRPITIHCRCGWGDKKTIGLAGTEGQTERQHSHFNGDHQF